LFIVFMMPFAEVACTTQQLEQSCCPALRFVIMPCCYAFKVIHMWRLSASAIWEHPTLLLRGKVLHNYAVTVTASVYYMFFISATCFDPTVGHFHTLQIV